MSAQIWFIFLFVIFLALFWLFYTRAIGSEYGPTTAKRARRMIELADVKKKDIVYDLGSGFGGLVIMASKNARKAIGIEFDSLRYAISIARAFFHGAKNVKFIRIVYFNRMIGKRNNVFVKTDWHFVSF